MIFDFFKRKSMELKEDKIELITYMVCTKFFDKIKNSYDIKSKVDLVIAEQLTDKNNKPVDNVCAELVIESKYRQDGTYLSDEKCLIIYTNTIYKESRGWYEDYIKLLIHSLAHELTHVKQHEENNYVFKNYVMPNYDGSNYKDYNQQDVEIEADRMASMYVKANSKVINKFILQGY